MLQQILKDLLARSVPVFLTLRNGEIAYEISGFYKSGLVTLYEEGGSLYVEARYGEVDQVESFDDLVYINYKWWQRSKERYDGWVNPEDSWVEDMVRLGLVQREDRTVITYK